MKYPKVIKSARRRDNSGWFVVTTKYEKTEKRSCIIWQSFFLSMSDHDARPCNAAQLLHPRVRIRYFSRARASCVYIRNLAAIARSQTAGKKPLRGCRQNRDRHGVTAPRRRSSQRRYAKNNEVKSLMALFRYARICQSDTCSCWRRMRHPSVATSGDCPNRAPWEGIFVTYCESYFLILFVYVTLTFCISKKWVHLSRNILI